MDISLIQLWLKNKGNYAGGVKLFNKYSKNNTLKKIFLTENAYTRKKLKEELQKLCSATPKDVAVNKKVLITSKEYPKIDIAKLPGDLLEKHIYKGKLYSRASRLHAELPLLPTKEERATTRAEIVRLFNEIDAIWQLIDDFVSGKKPTPKKQTVIDTTNPTEVYKRVMNLRTYITKHKDNPKRIADVMAWKKERAELEKKIKP